MQILHLEDSSDDAELIRAVLRREWPDCIIHHVATERDYTAALDRRAFDVILSDYAMPGFDGLSALEQARRRCPATPFLFLSGMIGEERAVDALKRGAADYILKDRPARLVPAIRQSLAYVTESARRRESEEALRQHDERFRLITENIADHISVVDLEGRVTYGNNASGVLFGATALQPGTDWFRRVEPADLLHVRRTFDRIVSTGAGERFEFRCRTANGETRYMEAAGVVVRDEGGRAGSVILVCRDVTDRRNSDARIREQASLLDKARDAIVASDLEHRITYWNASADRIYGLREAEVLGRRLDELGLGYDPAHLEEARDEVLAKGEWHGEFRLRTPAGTAVVVDSTWSLVLAGDGSPRSILAIDTDVTERKKLEAQLWRAQRLESIGTLAGGIAHDLNNVLTPILVTIDLLSAHVTSPDDRQLIEKTRASASHGAALVRQLLAFARGTEGERSSIDPAAALAKVEPLIRQTLPLDIGLVVRQQEPAWAIQANTTQLNQALINLALNARDAMPRGGRLEIRLDNVTVDAAHAAANPGTQPGRFVRITISDSGNGIPPAIIDRIFDPFFTTKAAGRRMGLGLSTVAGIVKHHGGFVQVESEVGRGTAFSLFFPASSAPAPAARSGPAVPARASGQGVLLIDDDPAVRDMFGLLLQRAGYAVYPADDAESALRQFAARRQDISLVITDMMLPGRSGLDVVKLLRVTSPRLPVVAISGMMDSGRFDELLRLDPPVECLSKPIPSAVLLNAAARALQGLHKVT